MASPTHFKCECQHCHGHLECPAEAADQVIECPHCGKTIQLFAAASQSKRAPIGKIVLLCVILLVVIAASVVFAGKIAERNEHLRIASAEATRLAAQQAAEAEAKANDPLAQAGWKVADIRIEKTSGSAIIHAVGTLQNETDRRRFGVKVQLDLFDVGDQKIGNATDYQPTIEAHARWQFSALVVNPHAVTAKVAAVAESP